MCFSTAMIPYVWSLIWDLGPLDNFPAWVGESSRVNGSFPGVRITWPNSEKSQLPKASSRQSCHARRILEPVSIVPYDYAVLLEVGDCKRYHFIPVIGAVIDYHVKFARTEVSFD